ncbi:MAG: hypothetical protein K9G26_11105 [Emcibacter sp.]|nr:hypothetical protein [Emcibacter sp.]
MSAVKFTFNDDFDDDTGNRLKNNKLEENREAAFIEGVEAGRNEILNSLNQSCEVLLQNILTATQRLHERQEEQIALMHKEAAKLSLSIIRKLAPAIVENDPQSEVETLIRQCLKNSHIEPRLVIRADDNILTQLQEKLDEMKHTNGFFGQVVLISEQMNHISDCRVEWANGGAERDYNKLMSDIENTLQLFIESPENLHNVKNRDVNPEMGTISETIVTD